jgi:hypothetical protein
MAAFAAMTAWGVVLRSASDGLALNRTAVRHAPE